MVRIRVQLTDDQHRQLRRWARRLGISLSDAVRRCIADRMIREEKAPSRDERVAVALAVCGRHRDPAGSSRVAIEHDRHLAEAYHR